MRRPKLMTALAAASLCTAATAAPLELIYNGAFDVTDAFGLVAGDRFTPFAETTPFTLRATFDGAAPNLVGALPFSGFVAIAPDRVTLDFNGTTYRVAGTAQNPTAGVAVALFDPSNVFFPGRYAAGVIADPARDGAGIVGDWSQASPGFSATNPVATEFLGYNGAGFSPGVGCAQGPGPCTVTPLELTDALGQRFGLVLSLRDEQFGEGAPLNTARVVAAGPDAPGTPGAPAAVPLPGTLALLAAGGALLAGRAGGRAARRTAPAGRAGAGA